MNFNELTKHIRQLNEHEQVKHHQRAKEAIARVSDMLANEVNAGDTISSWIEIENQRTMTKKWIKPKSMIKHFEFV
jgi:hypothetical protein